MVYCQVEINCIGAYILQIHLLDFADYNMLLLYACVLWFSPINIYSYKWLCYFDLTSHLIFIYNS